MSNLWPAFTRDSPCPSCNHFDWQCRQGERKYICMRVQSPHPSKDGGYYHEYSGNRPTFIPPARKSAPPLRNADGLMKLFVSDATTIGALALTLGVSTASLQNLQVAWSKEHHAFAVPMRDGDNNIIGIHLRGEDYKVAVKGSRNGLFLPQCEHDRMAFACEGMSNSAALLTMGFFPIGRPSCNTGGELVLSALRRLGIRKVCIVADGDEKKYQKKQCEDCKGSGRKHGLKCYECSGTGKVSDISKPAPRPGYEGAEKLKKELRGIQTVTWVPPSPMKGIRDFMLAMGVESANKILTSSINQKIWA